jgi:hypothetical protein
MLDRLTNCLSSILSSSFDRTGMNVTMIALQVFTGVAFLANTPAANANTKNYRQCADVLLRQGIAPQSAASACAVAWKPTQLSSCVADINRRNRAVLNPNVILNSCQQVRRPNDLSICVADISGKIRDVEPGFILQSCQNSLLPKLYSQCVLGLAPRVGLSGNDLLGTCLDPKNYTSNSSFPNNSTISEPMTPSEMSPVMEPIPPSRGNRTRNR